MKYCLALLLCIFTIKSHAECQTVIIKNSFSYNSSIISFILLNHANILNNINDNGGEYINSLITELYEQGYKSSLEDIILKSKTYSDSYEFALSILKDKN